MTGAWIIAEDTHPTSVHHYRAMDRKDRVSVMWRNHDQTRTSILVLPANVFAAIVAAVEESKVTRQMVSLAEPGEGAR